MFSARTLLLILIPSFLLASCFGSKAPEITVTPKDSPTSAVTPPSVTTDDVAAMAKEEKRVNSLDTLTAANLSTQVETKDGKKVLKDRRLFINYFKSKGVDSSAKLIKALEEVQKFAKNDGVTLNETDFLVMISGTQLESTSWNVCGNFNATKKDLDSANVYYGYINKLCNPPAPPKPSK